MTKGYKKKLTILAISSGGGHWVQLLRLRKAFDNHEAHYASVNNAYAQDIEGDDYSTIPDATRWNKLKLLWMMLKILLLIAKTRPDVIITTGAAPGYFALLIGKTVFKCKTVWLDSIANVEVMSLSGQKVSRFADLWLTQWEHLSGPNGPEFFGSVLDQAELPSK